MRLPEKARCHSKRCFSESLRPKDVPDLRINRNVLYLDLQPKQVLVLSSDDFGNKAACVPMVKAISN